MPSSSFFAPGRCYRRGDQLIRVVGPIFPPTPPEADQAMWREVSEDEWNAAVARSSLGGGLGRPATDSSASANSSQLRAGDLFKPGDPALDQLDRLSDGRGSPLQADEPQHGLMRDIARDLRAAGFELHDCGLMACTGGVCLTPCSQGQDVIVSWAQHDVLAFGSELQSTYGDVQELMNFAIAEVLGAMGWRVEPFGQASAYVVVGRADE